MDVLSYIIASRLLSCPGGNGANIKLDENGNIISVCPARVKYRGFTHETNTKGYIKTANYMKENAEEILKEAMQ